MLALVSHLRQVFAKWSLACDKFLDGRTHWQYVGDNDYIIVVWSISKKRNNSKKNLHVGVLTEQRRHILDHSDCHTLWHLWLSAPISAMRKRWTTNTSARGLVFVIRRNNHKIRTESLIKKELRLYIISPGLGSNLQDSTEDNTESNLVNTLTRNIGYLNFYQRTYFRAQDLITRRRDGGEF